MEKSIKSLGEFGLIKHITEKFSIQNKQIIKGIDDDAAVISNKQAETLITTDILLEGIHFDLMYTPLKHLGYKAVIVNLSDIYAMNGNPIAITVNIGISSKFSLKSIEELYEGIYAACQNYKVDLIGGDTSNSLTGLVISITAIGTAQIDKIVYRNTAQENDLICVSGDVGAAYIGLQILEREKQIFIENKDFEPKLDDAQYVVGRQLKPEAQKNLIEYFEQNSIKPTAMIDISDGISSEILHICSQSQVGCNIYNEKLPINTETTKIAQELNINPVVAAMNGGEDYELLFTINQSDYEKINNNADISIIGHITNKNAGCNLITEDNQKVEIKAQGWNAF